MEYLFKMNLKSKANAMIKTFVECIEHVYDEVSNRKFMFLAK